VPSTSSMFQVNQEEEEDFANTASAMGKLASAVFLHCTNIHKRLLTKVGADSVGRQLMDELNASNVDTNSPLFIVGHPGSTTAFTTIIVSQQEQTRTCIHTPGTSGELTLEDGRAVDLDGLLKDVVDLHPDARAHGCVIISSAGSQAAWHPDFLRRGVEPGNESTGQICDILFTNSNHLIGVYLDLKANHVFPRKRRNRAPQFCQHRHVESINKPRDPEKKISEKLLHIQFSASHASFIALYTK
jgi:hypothetical protein